MHAVMSRKYQPLLMPTIGLWWVDRQTVVVTRNVRRPLHRTSHAHFQHQTSGISPPVIAAY